VSRRRLADERGAALVEFALIFPVFLAVVIGTMSIVWLVGARSAITGAARDGARYASIEHDPLTACATPPCPTGYPTAAEITAYVTDRAGRYGVDSVSVAPSALSRNQVVTVTVTRTLPDVFAPFSALIGFGDTTYTSTAKARAE
jgi:Flp pilus assembly protein TadG